MSKKQRQERKEKKRKLISKQRVAIRRKKLLQEAKKIKEGFKLEKHFRVKLDPIKKSSNDSLILDSLSEAELEKKRASDWALKKLEHNMKILEALEAEIQKEEEERKKIQESLVNQGAVTLRDQMDLMGKLAEEKIDLINESGEENK